MIVTIAVEGATDVPVVRRLLRQAGLEPGPIYDKGGKAGLDRKLDGYNRAAAISPWLVLRDLDRDAPCAAELIRQKLPSPAPRMCFRVAVREVEAWLLADRNRVARYLGVDESLVPSEPDLLADPKQQLVNLARRSPRRTVREDFVPEDGTTAQVGPGYARCVGEFASLHWRPDVAAKASPSLARCLRALSRFPR